MNLVNLILSGCFLFQFSYSESIPCVHKNFGESSTVCVCNSTYCDTIEPLRVIPNGQFYHLVTSKSGQRFEARNGNINYEEDPEVDRTELWIERRLQYQKMIGFGGAFTDATGINFGKLEEPLQDNILRSYFGEAGIDYTIARIPIGGADFSSRPYTLCDIKPGTTDPELEQFSIQEDDHLYKIPYVKRAQALTPDLKLFASPWSAPAWMKSNDRENLTGMSYLKLEFYRPWANYFYRFLDEYNKQGIEFWAITPQNEPSHGRLIEGQWNSMGWTAAQQRDFIKNDLGPVIKGPGSDFANTKILMMDDQRFSVVTWSQTILGDPASAKYVDGIGVHWYANFYTPPFPLNIAHNLFPDYFMLNTEACTGYLHFVPGIDPVIMGSWERAELYAHNIIEDLNHWLTGWVEWNLILDMKGGPNWAGNMVDAPIIIDETAGEAYKQPMYFAMGHFSKFVTEDSIRIGHSWKESSRLEVLSVLRPDNKVVLVVYNPDNELIPLKITDSQQQGSIMLDIGPNSIHTIAYAVSSESDIPDGADTHKITVGVIPLMAIICVVIGRTW